MLLKVVASSTTYDALLTPSLTTPAYSIRSDTSSITSAEVFVVCNNTETSQAGSTTIVEPMLQFGTTAKDYEPYVRGNC